MRNNRVKPPLSASALPPQSSRRDLLRAAAVTTVAGLIGAALPAPAQDLPPPITDPISPVADNPAPPSSSANPPPDARPTTSTPTIDAPYKPWWLYTPKSKSPKSRVVTMSSARATRGAIPSLAVIDAMLAQSIQLLTGAPESAGWRSILADRRRIVIKLNSVGAAELGTNENVARAILRQLRRAEYDLAAVTLIEAAPDLYREFACRRPALAWASGIPVGDDTEQLMQSVADADAIINVGLLKTHRFAGMSACLKNLAYGVIRRPARYHANGCTPFIRQIIGSREIAEPLRLNIVNALRLIVRGGPEVTDGSVQDYGGLILGFDPVAVDFIAADALTTERKRLQLGEGPVVPYLQDAIQQGLGRGDWSSVERLAREVAV